MPRLSKGFIIHQLLMANHLLLSNWGWLILPLDWWVIIREIDGCQWHPSWRHKMIRDPALNKPPSVSHKYIASESPSNMGVYYGLLICIYHEQENTASTPWNWVIVRYWISLTRSDWDRLMHAVQEATKFQRHTQARCNRGIGLCKLLHRESRKSRTAGMRVEIVE